MPFIDHQAYITCDAISVPHGFGVRDGALPLPADAVVASSRQVHGDHIRIADGRDYAPEADGLMTAVAGVALCVRTADCVPILLHDSKKRVVAAVHAGWRGTALDIAGKAVREMTRVFGSAPGDIAAAIGPAIGACCFETDHDVPEAMRRLLGSAADPFIEVRGPKFHVDIPAVNAALLRRAGAGQIEVCDLCTRCRADRFWSFRAHGGAGRQYHYIML